MHKISAILLGAAFLMMLSFFLPVVYADNGSSVLQTGDLGSKLLAASIAFGLAAAGAGYGLGQSGAAAMAAVAEKPEMRTTALLFLALAEAIAIYGFVMAIIILGQTA